MSKINNISFYRDGESLELIPEDICILLRKVGVIEDGTGVNESKKFNKASVSFCGLLYGDNSIYVFLPKCHPIPESLELGKKAVRELIGCISNYCIEHGNNIHDLSEIGRIGIYRQLLLYKNIIDNYIEYGLFRSGVKLSKRNGTGKVDWGETIKKLPYITSHKQQVVYSEFVTENFSYSSETIIANIHAAIINEIDKKYGWWFTDITSGRIASELRFYHFNGEDKRMLSNILKKELRGTFNERLIRLLKNLISYLEYDSATFGKGIEICGISKFELLWERMLLEVLKPTAVDLKAMLPVPAYRTSSGKLSLLKSKKGRIDIIIKEGGVVEIIDAKYYNAYDVRCSPGWSDLVKQFLYEKLVSSIDNKLSIGSFFVLPNANNADRPEQGLIARVQDEMVEILSDIFPPVNCIYVCPQELIYNYNNKKLDSQLRQRIFSMIS
ncbi:LlaJI family restriction endonuclease [Aeromonas salmonicida]|uniref:LlaJI family restriction endonuclease n=1 Tax=Aeromonas salmonicida TaxID=645 RepID=UPI0027966646|nr:LlaJI family restriction endonuclease [Aeromonas salmonicida]MDQ1886228.1 LlaJI family restriction endonuclease [Aeromonas salmonicida]